MRGRASRTAEAVALLRGIGGLDPYTATFLAPAWRPLLRLPPGQLTNLLSARLLATVSARTHFIDGVITAALAGGCTQLVLLGAGFDARPWRLAADIGERPVFLVDHPATAAVRAQRGAALPRRADRRVDVDFARGDLRKRLLSAGFETDRPTAFVWEGVSMYLPERAVRQMLGSIAELGGPGSALAFDLWGRGGFGDRFAEVLGRVGLALIGEPLDFTCAADAVEALLEDAGLALEALTTSEAVATEHALGHARPSMLLVHASRRSPVPVVGSG